jgi:cytochrome d ubiquinol oxidase subunit II
MELVTVWFILIAVLWLGYLVLDGFDLGVGMLLPFIGKDDLRRRVMINTIGPVWDGNEVWLLVAGGATFAAFPLWYATLFSGFYLALFLLVLAVVLRGVAFGCRSKEGSVRWRVGWDRAIFVGSVLPPLLLGVAFGNIFGGSKIGPIAGTPADFPLTTDAGPINYLGNFFDLLLNPFALVIGVMLVLVFATHGAIFLALKTSGEVREASRRVAVRVGVAAAVFAVIVLLWAQAYSGRVAITLPIVLIAAVLWLGGTGMTLKGRDGWAFLLSAGTIALAVTALFVGAFPNIMLSSIDSAFNLTVHNSSSQSYTLTVMTIVAVIMTPIVLIYQGWTYWVFRKRISTSQIPEQSAPGRADDRFAVTKS